MAHDDRRGGGRRERDERGPEWRGDDGFGGGWGNQVPRPHRLGGRDDRGRDDDPDYSPRYGEGGGWYGPDAADSDYRYGAPGLGRDHEGPRFDRAHGARGHGGRSSAGDMFGSAAGAFAFRREAEPRHDPHYAEWRHRRMSEFDRDYEDYVRENQSRFDREFGQWRERRSEQRAALGRAKEQMDVIGSDGGHVGKVDCTRGDRLVLTRSDASAGGVHHAIPCGWIDRVDDKVVLNIEAEEARRRWQTEDRSRALFEREDLGRRGPHVLNRSFSGTYSDEE